MTDKEAEATIEMKVGTNRTKTSFEGLFPSSLSESLLDNNNNVVVTIIVERELDVRKAQ